ncbi:uncharacterized protein Dere_GG26323, partial [Drosophila erecta]
KNGCWRAQLHFCYKNDLDKAVTWHTNNKSDDHLSITEN